MDASDMAAAQAFQAVRSRLETGPWNTGELGGKGFVVTEPLGSGNEVVDDGIARYTDRYLSRRTVGRTAQDFPFNPQLLPTELYRAAGLEHTSSAPNGKASDHSDTPDRLKRLQRLENLAETENGDAADAAEEPKDEPDEDEENAGDAEDEFEELDDDDYNAEKYFDDGEDFGDGDDGDDEAAY